MILQKENDRLYRYPANGLSTNKNGHLCIILCVNQELRAYAFVLATWLRASLRLWLFQMDHKEVATQMEEYAPLMKPMIMHSAKFFVVSPPKKYKDKHANNTVVNV